jgi:transposase
MRYSYVCGIDISKHHLDLSLIKGAGPQLFSGRCENTPNDLEALLNELPVDDLSSVLFCAENTGMYGYILQQIASNQSLALWIEHPGQIKACNGLQRGKTDPADAERIARYGWRYQDQVRLWQQADSELDQLRYLQSEAVLLVADRAKYKGQLSDQADYMPTAVYQSKQARLAAIIAVFDEQIAQIECQIKTIIAGSQKLNRQNRLLQSIPGVGPRVALAAIILTKGFTCFDNARAFCCYCGLAPFVWHSGTDTNTKARVSHRADKRMKSLLHMGAMAAVKRPGELKIYYERKCKEGKPKMSVINAVRSKLVHRMFAVVKQNRMYQPAIPTIA